MNVLRVDPLPGYAKTKVDVCVCSFKRPEILETLRAIAGQADLTNCDVRIVVADNTQSGDMKQIVLEASEELKLNLQYVHAPANNISIARNACLDAASATWIAFIDDDEIPDACWLNMLLVEAEKGSWDAVLGPVDAIYADNAPLWLRQGNFHSTRPVFVGGQIKTGYTGNVLLRNHFARACGLRFRAALGKSGGEDEDFFNRFVDAGGRIGFSPRALVHEPVPESRANLRWLMRRNFRAGQTYGARLAERGFKSRLPDIVVAMSKAIVCAAGAMFLLPKRVARNRFIIRLALHIGVVARLSGLSEIHMY